MRKRTLFIVVISYQLLATSFNAQAQFTDLYNFNDTTGAFPSGSLVVSGNVMYGMTPIGGANTYGLIFSIHTDGSRFKDLWDFADTGSTGNASGIYPNGSLTLSGNTLYGVTNSGGVNNFGNIFSIDTNGSGYKDLWDFGNPASNGQNALCTLVISGNKIYGMTAYGGIGTWGNIFSININGGGYKDLWNFDGGGDTNGTEPFGSLILSGKTLYGMTEDGGINGWGNVFSIDTNGSNYKDLFNFNDTNGANPDGSLILSGKVLYGMTGAGGNNTLGIVFSLDTNGQNFTDLLQFNDSNGASHYGNLTLSGNLLYGMTSGGGRYGYTGGGTGNGVIFSIATNGKQDTVIFNFDTAYGINPQQSLRLSGGTLYGMANGGGANNDGTIFSYNLCYLLTSKQHSQASDTGGCFGTASITPSGGPAPYSYLWQDGQTEDTITGQCPGTYTCTITDNNGCTTTASVTVNSTTTGINSITSNSGEINLYPNPNNGIFTVSLSHAELVSASQKIEVYNVLGEQVLTKTFRSAQGDNTVDMSNQPDGIYLYRVITTNGELIGEGKVIVQR